MWYNDVMLKINTQDLIGKKFGQLTIIATDGFGKRGKATVTCRCDCGKLHTCVWGNVRGGKTSRCPECHKAKHMERITKHGGAYSREYRIWSHIKIRCRNTNDKMYKYYGGRGIKICDKWFNSFEEFRKDVGPRPSTIHSLDRINNDGHYEPGNVRWATPEQQSQNTRIARKIQFHGGVFSASYIARKLSISAAFVSACDNRGITGDEMEDFLATYSRE